MQFFTVTLLLVALAQSNAQSGSGSGGGLNGSLQALEDDLNIVGIEGASGLVNNLRKSLASGGLLSVLPAVLPILVQIVLSIFGEGTLDDVTRLITNLATVLQQPGSPVIQIVGSVIEAVAGLLSRLFSFANIGTLSLGR